MNDPIAFFLTVATYGTWLPGDPRGWVEYRHGWQLPDRVREFEARLRMGEDACILTRELRTIVEHQVAETCGYRGWVLHAVNCRSNHMHIVVSAANVTPNKVRSDLKAWSTRRLKQYSGLTRDNWWAERGSIRWIFGVEVLELVVEYVKEAQDLKYLDKPRRGIHKVTQAPQRDR